MSRSDRKAACRVRRRLQRNNELVEVGLEVLAAQAMVDAERPGLEVREHAMGPGQDEVGGHRADDVGLVMDVGSAWVTGPAIGAPGAMLPRMTACRVLAA
jgi:hypothetical protein